MKNKLLIAALLVSALLSDCRDPGATNPTPSIANNTDTWEDGSEYEETDYDNEDDIYEGESDPYEDESEDELWEDEIAEEPSYIAPDYYDITGKWKSIGDSGFGQAQPGAIIIFDGNNCNFYSPNDTYAFYKKNDKYVLDITSVLGESLNKTVNIIDDNNIEVAGASLRRVE